MQLLYGNDGVNYRVLDKSSEMSDGIYKSMLATYSKYDFVSNGRAYTSVDKEPECITYVTSNLDNQMREEELVLCKTGHMSQYSSPSYYFHGVVEHVSRDFYEKEFFKIFNYKFIRDIQVANFTNGSIDSFEFTDELFNDIKLTDEQLIVILAKFMSNEKAGVKTKILVDKTGDDYNTRSREILAAIYHYLPYELRKRYGFKSYCQDEKGIPGRVSFVLYNQDETVADEDFITLTESVDDILKTIDHQYVEYATFLVKGTDEVSRKKHFDSLSKLARDGRLKITECITYFKNLQQWSDGSQETLLPEWIQYIDKNSFRKGPLYERLLEIIVEKVENEYYNDYLFDKVLSAYGESIYNLSPNAAKTIRFADCLEEIYIIPERFHAWYQAQFAKKIANINPASPTYAVRLQELYDDEIRALKEINIMSEELTILLQTEIKALEGTCNQMEEEKNNLIDTEKTIIHRKLEALTYVSIEEYVKGMVDILNQIQFEEVRKELSDVVDEWIGINFPKKFANELEVNKYFKAVKKLQEVIPFSKFQECMTFITNEIQRLQAEKEALNCMICKSEILKNYGKLYTNLENQILNPTDKIKITFGNNGSVRYISANELIKVLEFILCPDDDNRSVCSVCWRFFLETDVLKAEHFRFLVASVSRESEAELILNYYFSTQIPLSGSYMANVIWKKYGERANLFIESYENRQGNAKYFIHELKKLLGLESKSVQSKVQPKTSVQYSREEVSGRQEEKSSADEKNAKKKGGFFGLGGKK